MRHILITALAMFLISNNAFADTSILTDSDMPMMRDALKKSYTPELCKQDLPNASAETCACIGDAMAKNLNADKLKLCKKDGYDECVAAEFTAAKASLTEEQINQCKALTKENAATSDDDAEEN